MKNPAMIVPNAMAAMQALGATTQHLPPKLAGLVHLRVSQLNGCSSCIAGHKSDDSPQRMMLTAAWRDAPYFTDAERAALALAEAETRLGDGVPDAIWEACKRHFDEPTLAALVLHIGLVNLWNRLNVTTKQVAGAW